MYFERNIEGIIENSLSRVPAVVLLGPRQVGKTTLVKHLMEHFEDGIYLDLERPSDLQKLSDPEIYLETNADKRIVIDEVQRKPTLFPLLRSLIDARPTPGRFVLLGSASNRLILSASESLAGRVRYLELEPFNILEGTEVNKLWLQGGFPRAYLNNSSDGFEWMADFVRAYIERELAGVNFRINSVAFERFIQIISSVHGQLVSYNTISKSTGLSTPTTKEYLEFLEQSYLIRIIYPFYANLKKRLTKSPKIYFRDSGILHYLRGITDMESLQSDILKGPSWEGFVIQQIVSMLDPGYKYFFYRTSHGAELDLIITRGSQVMASFEIKYSNSPSTSKGMLECIKDLNPLHNFIVTPYADEYMIKKNIVVIPIGRLFAHLKNLKLTYY